MNCLHNQHVHADNKVVTGLNYNKTLSTTSSCTSEGCTCSWALRCLHLDAQQTAETRAFSDMGDSAFRDDEFKPKKVVTLSPIVKGFAGEHRGVLGAVQQQHVLTHTLLTQMPEHNTSTIAACALRMFKHM